MTKPVLEIFSCSDGGLASKATEESWEQEMNRKMNTTIIEQEKRQLGLVRPCPFMNVTQLFCRLIESTIDFLKDYRNNMRFINIVK
jgi:hypothetical protein